MLQWICGNIRRDRIRNNDIHERLGVAPVEKKLVQHRDRHHHALTSCRRWPKSGWWSGTCGGGLPRTTDVGDRRGRPLTGWRAVRDRSQCSRRGRGRAWRSSRCRSGQKSRRDCRSGKGSHKWLESQRDLRGWLARCHGTCSGESGSNSGDRGARLTKKI
jgi:hypothetical protein